LPMSTRVGFWLAGLATGSVLAIVASMIRDGGHRGEYAAVALLLGILAVGLLGEVMVASRKTRPARDSLPPADPSPADGEVGRALMAGVRGEPNANDPRFHRYAELLPISDTALVRRRKGKASSPLLGR